MQLVHITRFNRRSYRLIFTQLDALFLGLIAWVNSIRQTRRSRCSVYVAVVPFLLVCFSLNTELQDNERLILLGVSDFLLCLFATLMHDVAVKRQESRAIAGRTARCRWKFRHVSNFTIRRRVYLHSNFSGGLRKTFFYFCKSDVSGVQGHPRSLILVPIESAYATSCKSIIVTLFLSCTVSEILQGFLCSWPHPYSILFCGVPVGPDRRWPDRRCWGSTRAFTLS